MQLRHKERGRELERCSCDQTEGGGRETLTAANGCFVRVVVPYTPHFATNTAQDAEDGHKF
jgi:hypothetical protein